MEPQISWPALRPATKLSMGVADATQLPVLLDHAIAAATSGLPVPHT